MQRLRTGDVSQIRSYGKNYVILGKCLNEKGENEILLVKNGLLRRDGKVRNLPRNRNPRVYVTKPSTIRRVHGHRNIDLDNVREKVPMLGRVLVRMDAANGIPSIAPSIADVVVSANTLNIH